MRRPHAQKQKGRRAIVSARSGFTGTGSVTVGLLTGLIFFLSCAHTTCHAATMSKAYPEGLEVSSLILSHMVPVAALPAWAYADTMKDGLTAVYDISAHVVVLPDGARLEAHSGLRDDVDEPRFVRERMRGPTPPALYELAPREKAFHGVTALRLKAVSGEVFGRTGLLMHTYMLGGRPESNGCVVFRDYAAFLKAFRDGRVKRLRVVPSVGEAALRIG